MYYKDVCLIIDETHFWNWLLDLFYFGSTFDWTLISIFECGNGGFGAYVRNDLKCQWL